MPRLRPPFRPLAWGFLDAALLAAAPPSLRPGEPVERALAAGDSQAYQVELTAGRPWLVTVEQRGVDVVVEVAGPDGKRLAAVDSRSIAMGRRPCWSSRRRRASTASRCAPSGYPFWVVGKAPGRRSLP